MKEEKKFSVAQVVLKVLQGALIGLGAVLPGMSGGVLCVVFGIYTTVMEFLADPFRKFKTHVPKLVPIGIGGVIGVILSAKVLETVLEAEPNASVCLFVGLIVGTLPSLFREAGEQGRTKASYVSMVVAMITVSAILIALAMNKVSIEPNFGWYLFCGFCVALSVIAPGMSFSTLLMPIGLYNPLMEGIGNLNFAIIIPCGIGALVTVILLAKAVDNLLKKHYSVSFHAIVGVVIAATVMLVVIPNAKDNVDIIGSFANSAKDAIVNTVCIVVGVVVALALDKFNSKYEV